MAARCQVRGMGGAAARRRGGAAGGGRRAAGGGRRRAMAAGQGERDGGAWVGGRCVSVRALGVLTGTLGR